MVGSAGFVSLVWDWGMMFQLLSLWEEGGTYIGVKSVRDTRG
jgi:hypothetical protein